MAEESEREPEDTHVRKKRRRLWLWIPAWILGVLLIVALAGWAVVGGRSRVRWKAFQARHGVLRTQVETAPTSRRPLEGDGVPGNAWTHYEAAYACYAALGKKEQDQLQDATLSKVTPEKDALAFAVLDAHPEIFAAIRKGARCDSYDAPYQWERGFDMPLEWLAHSRLMSRLLAVQARRRRGEGDLDGAIDAVVLGCQIGADIGRSGVLICWLVGVAIRGITMAQAGPIAADPALTAAQAQRLENLMSRLEEELTPLHASVKADRLSMGYSFLTNEEAVAAGAMVGGDPGNSLGRLRLRVTHTWRHGGSWRLAFAAVDEKYEEMLRLIEKGESLPWTASASEFASFSRSLESDPLLSTLMYAPDACENSGRSGLARIRMVRALCHERRAGAPESPLPLDPHTLLPLHRRVEPDKTVYWAEWSDGDQGGKGKFEDNPSSSGDIVLEWKR